MNKAANKDDVLEVLQDLVSLTSDGFVRLEGRMDRLEGRMDNLDGKMDRLEGQMDGLEERMGGIEVRTGAVESRMGGIETTLADHGRAVNKLNNTVERIENEQKAQTNDIGEILDRVVTLERAGV